MPPFSQDEDKYFSFILTCSSYESYIHWLQRNNLTENNILSRMADSHKKEAFKRYIKKLKREKEEADSLKKRFGYPIKRDTLKLVDQEHQKSLLAISAKVNQAKVQQVNEFIEKIAQANSIKQARIIFNSNNKWIEPALSSDTGLVNELRTIVSTKLKAEKPEGKSLFFPKKLKIQRIKSSFDLILLEGKINKAKESEEPFYLYLDFDKNSEFQRIPSAVINEVKKKSSNKFDQSSDTEFISKAIDDTVKSAWIGRDIKLPYADYSQDSSPSRTGKEFYASYMHQINQQLTDQRTLKIAINSTDDLEFFNTLFIEMINLNMLDEKEGRKPRFREILIDTSGSSFKDIPDKIKSFLTGPTRFFSRSTPNPHRIPVNTQSLSVLISDSVEKKSFSITERRLGSVDDLMKALRENAKSGQPLDEKEKKMKSIFEEYPSLCNFARLLTSYDDEINVISCSLEAQYKANKYIQMINDPNFSIEQYYQKLYDHQDDFRLMYSFSSVSEKLENQLDVFRMREIEKIIKKESYFVYDLNNIEDLKKLPIILSKLDRQGFPILDQTISLNIPKDVIDAFPETAKSKKYLESINGKPMQIKDLLQRPTDPNNFLQFKARDTMKELMQKLSRTSPIERYFAERDESIKKKRDEEAKQLYDEMLKKLGDESFNLQEYYQSRSVPGSKYDILDDYYVPQQGIGRRISYKEDIEQKISDFKVNKMLTSLKTHEFTDYYINSQSNLDELYSILDKVSTDHSADFRSSTHRLRLIFSQEFLQDSSEQNKSTSTTPQYQSIIEVNPQKLIDNKESIIKGGKDLRDALKLQEIPKANLSPVQWVQSLFSRSPRPINIMSRNNPK